MYTIDLNDNPHKFEKQNLVTTKGGFDILKCDKCGIKGNTTSLSTISVKGSYSKNKIDNCTLSKKEMKKGNTGRSISITLCTATGKIFENLTPNSEHIVIDNPKGESIDSKGVWVMGVGEPVKVLNSEFNYID